MDTEGHSLTIETVTYHIPGLNASLCAPKLPLGDPAIPEQSRWLSLLHVQQNSIGGLGSDKGEYDIRQDCVPSHPGSCVACNCLSTARAPKHLQPTIQGNLLLFEETAKQGCEICGLILAAVAPYQGPAGIKVFVNPGLALNIIIDARDKNARYDLFTAIGEKPSPWRGIGQARVIARTAAGDEAVDLVQNWMQDCAKHEICHQVGQTFSPTRVIHILDHHIRLNDVKQEELRYVALSHCWGDPESIPKATKNNLASLKVKIDWNTLSKTFQDAITVTRKLGIQYIWIDALCIIQDDDADWNREATQMAQIYENAALVISATAAKNGSVGLFGPRPPTSILASTNSAQVVMRPDELDNYQGAGVDLGIDGMAPPLASTVIVRTSGSKHRYFRRPCEDGSSGDVVYVARDTARHTQWDRLDMIAQHPTTANPLLSRAWAFQERLLATRIVHFAEHELTWECAQTQKCECAHLDAFISRPQLERKQDIRLLFSEISRKEQPCDEQEAFAVWREVVELYNERALTFEKDRLPALAGAAEKIRKSLENFQSESDSYLAGLFLKDFATLWHVPQPGIRHVPYYAPTWSWASIVMSRPQQPNRAKFTGKIVAKLCLALVNVLTMNFEVGREVQALCLGGPLIQVNLSIQFYSSPSMTEGGTWDSIYFDAPLRDYQYAVSKDDKKVNFEADVILHDDKHKLEDGAELFLLAVSQSSDEQFPDSMLVLKRLDSQLDCKSYVGTQNDLPVDDSLKGLAFARIGVLSIDYDSEANRGYDWNRWFSEAVKQLCVLF